MSVLACARKGCDNCMCVRYSEKHGYLCNDCFDELVNSGSKTDISSFMNSERDEEKWYGAYEKYDHFFPVQA